MKKHYCLDCKKEINKKSKRCYSCGQKERFKNPKNHPRLIDGKTFKKYYCIDCEKKLGKSAYQGKKRCRKCNGIYHSIMMKGGNNPNWQEGISKLPYAFEFTNELKESIRRRDNYECQNCEMTEEEHLIVIGKVLPIHHIDYNKENCNKNNLITLCNQCNSRANSNRDYWQEFYQNKINIILTENGGITNGRI